MADIIGVLGELTGASALTVATHTVYTVPAGKAAKVKLFYLMQATGSSPDLTITVNGINVMVQTGITASNYVFSSTAALYEKTAAAPDGAAAATTAGLAPETYYLSAGDTVTYTVGSNALSSMNFQVVGTEVDAS